MNFNLIPFEQLGDFVLAKPFYTIPTIKFIEGNFDEFKMKPYYYEDILTIYVDEESNVDHVSCFKYCFYKGTNLIGMNLQEFMELTGENYIGNIDILDFEEDGIPQYVYEFERIGLQVWMKNNIIVTIIVSQLSDYEE